MTETSCAQCHETRECVSNEIYTYVRPIRLEANGLCQSCHQQNAATTKPQRRGRGPQKAPTKVAVNLRIDPTVLEAYKSTGAGWQRRMHDAIAAGQRKLPR